MDTIQDYVMGIISGHVDRICERQDKIIELLEILAEPIRARKQHFDRSNRGIVEDILDD